jgi:hypothetical protein
VIAIELAVTGALLFEIDFFDRSRAARRSGQRRPDPRILLLLALVLSATVFGSLAAMLRGGGELAASAVTVGVAISMLPIFLRVLPPVVKDAATDTRDPHYAFTLAGLLLYVAVVIGAVALLNA